MSREGLFSQSAPSTDRPLQNDSGKLKPSPKQRLLMDLHEKAQSEDCAFGKTSHNSGRPRSYTADETFQLAKNWLLKRKQRRSSSSRSTSDVLNNADRSGSLSMLWSSGRPETLSVVVIGQPKSGKTTLINRLVDCWCENHKNESPLDPNGRRFSFDDESERIWVKTEDPGDGLGCWSKLRFVEVDPEKNDLWGTLSGSGFMVTYSALNSSSIKGAAKVLTWLRMPARSPSTPIWLVGTMGELAEPDLRKQVHAEAKVLAQTFRCDWLEMTSQDNNLKNGHHSSLWWGPQKLLGSILSRLVFAEKSATVPQISSRRASDKMDEENSLEKLTVKREVMRKISSHSCEDLLCDDKG